MPDHTQGQVTGEILSAARPAQLTLGLQAQSLTGILMQLSTVQATVFTRKEAHA